MKPIRKTTKNGAEKRGKEIEDEIIREKAHARLNKILQKIINLERVGDCFFELANHENKYFTELLLNGATIFINTNYGGTFTITKEPSKYSNVGIITIQELIGYIAKEVGYHTPEKAAEVDAVVAEFFRENKNHAES